MTEGSQADRANQDAAEQVDDIIPSYGYRKVPVVGLGGSAGSIEALQAFFTIMPSGSSVAFVVVIHLSPDHHSMLAELIQRCTRMPVVRVEEALRLEAGTVYVIPPGRLLQSDRGELKLAQIPEGRARHVTVDVFFRTLADSHGPHAAAVVLSGLDGDGTVGIKRIKERGGLTVAQDPGEAIQPSMPRNAIETGMVDWVLPVKDMPARADLLPPRAIGRPAAGGPTRRSPGCHRHARVRPARRAGLSAHAQRPRLLLLQARHGAAPAGPAHAGERGGQPDRLPDVPAHPQRGMRRAAAGPADQRHQLLPRPGLLRRPAGAPPRPVRGQGAR